MDELRSIRFQSGHYSPEGYSAYAVLVWKYDDFETVGIVWRKKGYGQRSGDWYYEPDGGRPSFQGVMTRKEAAAALLADRDDASG